MYRYLILLGLAGCSGGEMEVWECRFAHQPDKVYIATWEGGTFGKYRATSNSQTIIVKGEDGRWHAFPRNQVTCVEIVE